jgi:hypothetical protein
VEVRYALINDFREQIHIRFAVRQIPVAGRCPFDFVTKSAVRYGFYPLQNAFDIRAGNCQPGNSHGIFAKKWAFIAEVENFLC